jgi:glycosyltransferase involved in cell wall biosynthesis
MKTEREHRNLRVLFLADGLAPFVLGGMQQHSTQLVKHMAPLVESITLVHCGELNGNFPASDEVLAELGDPDNVDVVGLPFRDDGFLPGHYIRASLRMSRSFYEAIGDRLNSYDSVYAQGLMGDAFLDKHPKVLVNLHGLNMFQQSFSLSEKFTKRLLKPIFKKQILKAWRNVSLGGKLFVILEKEGVPKDSIIEIPNGIESSWILTEEERKERYEKRKKGKLRFVMVGRSDFVKGLHVLNAAMGLLKRPIELHMIGDWPEWGTGIHDVIYHGVIRDKTELMVTLDECDVLLIPSLSEGMPTVALEAMARGLQVIGADVGAMSKLGIEVFHPGDSEQLACSMSRIKLKLDTDNFPVEYTWGKVAKLTCACLQD